MSVITTATTARELCGRCLQQDSASPQLATGPHLAITTDVKVLLAIDGSTHSRAALEAVASRAWPADCEILVLTVIHSRWPTIGDPVFTTAASCAESMQEQERTAQPLLDTALKLLQNRAPDLRVTTKALEGVPHDTIVQQAEDWGADLIVLGSHGYGPLRRALLGSVAAAVAVEAPCPVEIIRIGKPGVKIRTRELASTTDSQPRAHASH